MLKNHDPGPPLNTFIIRFWRISSASEEAEGGHWYGEVKHIQSGKGRAFRYLEQMMRFIQEYVGMESRPKVGPQGPIRRRGSENKESEVRSCE